MSKVFISYRQKDDPDAAGRIRDRLEGHFGSDSIFLDIASIPPGESFRTYIPEQVAKCDVLLAIIGDGWLDARDDAGRRKLDDPDDWVAIEIGSALERETSVIPVLVGGARVPSRCALPEMIRDLSDRQAVEVRAGPRFDSQVRHVIQGIERRVLWGYTFFEFVSRLPRLLSLLAVLALANLLWVRAYKGGSGIVLLPVVLILVTGTFLAGLGRVRPWWVTAVAAAAQVVTVLYWLSQASASAAFAPTNLSLGLALVVLAWFYRSQDHGA